MFHYINLQKWVCKDEGEISVHCCTQLRIMLLKNSNISLLSNVSPFLPSLYSQKLKKMYMICFSMN